MRGGRFSDELLELGSELIEADVRAVILIGGGEPLAHPRFPANSSSRRRWDRDWFDY